MPGRSASSQRLRHERDVQPCPACGILGATVMPHVIHPHSSPGGLPVGTGPASKRRVLRGQRTLPVLTLGIPCAPAPLPCLTARRKLVGGLPAPVSGSARSTRGVVS